MSMSSPSPGASSSFEVPFTPRKEFIRDIPSHSSSFALLALSSANCIRLYSFTPQAVAALRSLFEQSVILSYREDSEHNLLEFALNTKPWSNPKSVPTEKLLVDILAIIYQCGYQYRSTIDYGREADDRLAMVFSRLNTSPREHIPTSPPPTGGLSHLSLGDTVKLVPFAISFSSVTVMRVISPPLHLTPAILQAVRASWPRGVVSEKKVGDNSYEFKLKGYKWFQQDTFASDSLQHILTLLTSLDAQSFTLLTSVSLTNRSRVKDLWIFTGPVPEGSNDSTPPVSLPGGSYGDLAQSPTPIQHRRFATDPTPNTPYSPTHQHARSGTDSPQRTRFPPPPPPPHTVLRKPAPRAQVPVSVVRDSLVPEIPEPQQRGYRTYMPSTISDSVENMTGVGASPEVIYSSSPFGLSKNNERANSPPYQIKPRAEDTYGMSGSAASSNLPPRINTPPNGSYMDNAVVGHDDSGSRPLLGGGAFRDSNVSGQSDLSYDIPIKWTGPLKEELQAAQVIQAERASAKQYHTPTTPMLPGGWQPTPIDERSEDYLTPRNGIVQDEKVTTPIHEMLSRIESPEVVGPTSVRKSESALVGLIQETSPLPPVPPIRQKSQRSQPSESKTSLPNSNSVPVEQQGRGWILVNVEDHPSSQSGPEMGGKPYAAQMDFDSPGPIPPPGMASPSAKAIAVIDAMDPKHKKSQSQNINTSKDGREGTSGVRRFFSLNRKNSSRKKAADEDSAEDDKSATSSTPRSNLRDRLRRIRTPEASRREDMRRSID